MDETTKKKIIVIDDDKFLLDMYAMKFVDQGYDVTPCSSAEEALEKVHGGIVPDIFVVDIVMQGMDGFSFVKEIREKKLADKAAVVILSNLGQKEDVEKGLALGADGYIVKASATPSEVVEKVFEIVKNKKT
ncbi:MAG: response regulator [Candidatus Vogelbacteria bacterium]|nr:response regulator [Candidatus Vogelbacteria bacterium]